ncbi:hypothetical protein BDB01DRAFT_849816 [Pilobolus umbonatus]|nr:hypothetical protein BDB01DRAFT_849816 [Pilobolus umbonatus]
MSLEALFDVPLVTDPIGAKKHYAYELHRISTAVISDYCLQLGSHTYSLLEVEAYLNAPNHHHSDPYCHSHPKQRPTGAWYFHHVGMSKGFKGGTRKGIDITIGNKKLGSAGGLLIRAIMNDTTKTIIEGPCLVVDVILKELGHAHIKDLVETRWKDIPGWCYESDSGFYLVPKEKSQDEVYSTPRIGLGLTNTTPSIESRFDYIGRLYRYTVKPDQLKKGTIWTVFSMLIEAKSVDEICKVNNLKTKVVERYRDAYTKGREKSKDTLKSCLEKDILSNGNVWKIQVQSAIYKAYH